MILQFHRLGLERADTAEKAVDVITELLEKHGQGGSCMEDDSGFTYHNSFLISDRKEAWLLETSGKYWAAERVEGNQRRITDICNTANELKCTGRAACSGISKIHNVKKKER